MFNGIDVTQTRDYIKISCKSFIDKCCNKHLATWMSSYLMAAARPTPLPCDPSWFKKFNAATGDPDPKKQADLAKQMNLSYRSGVGELIWAMTTCRPDLAYASVKLSQSNGCPHEHHYHGLRHALKYMYTTRDDGLYFWRTKPRVDPIATYWTYSWTIAWNMMLPPFVSMLTWTGLPASKPALCLEGYACVLLVARLRTRQNFNQLLQVRQRRPNSWRPRMLVK